MQSKTYGAKRSSPLHVSKQKQWRARAGSAKRMAINQGLHEIGRRYGRFAKMVFGTQKLTGQPSDLFINIALNEGILKLTS